MNTEQNHIIQYQIFEIEGCTRLRAVELQNRVSRMADGLKSITEEVLERVAGLGSLIKIDRLHLDMGSMPYEHFEAHFMERYADILEKELLARIAFLRPIASRAGTANEQDNGLRITCLELLEYFLVKGVLPWWTNGKLHSDPPAVMDWLLQEESASLRGLLQRIGQAGTVRQRLVYQFPVQTMPSLLKILEPGQAIFLLDYHASLSKVQQLKRIIPTELPSFERAVWLFILSYLLVDKGNQFNRKEFVRSTLHQMALHFNRNYRELLGLFAAVLPTDDPVFQLAGALPRILKDLAVEQGVLPETGRSAAKEKDPPLERIRYYLRYGSLPFSTASLPATELSGIFALLIQRIPVSVKEMMRTFYDLPAIPPRITAAMEESVVYSLITLLEPSGAPLIHRYLERLPLLQQQRPLVNMGYKNFGRAIRGVVLSFLLSERGSVFNTKIFLESHIRGMARHFNVSYRELLTGMLQGWQQGASSGGESFLPLLKALLDEEEKVGGITGSRKDAEKGIALRQAGEELRLTGEELRQKKEETSLQSKGEGKLEIPEKMEGKQEKELALQRAEEMRMSEKEAVFPRPEEELRRKKEETELQNRKKEEPLSWEIRSRDLLQYWLHYGRLPWWSYEGEQSPEVIWRELMKKNPRALLSLFQWAGRSAVRRKRLFSLLSAGGVLESIKLLPGGQSIVRHYAVLLVLTGKGSVLRIRSEAEQQELLLQALWDTGIEGHYIRWEEVVFVRRVLLRLAGWTGIYPAVLARALWRAAIRGGELSYSPQLQNAVRKFAEGEWSLEGGADADVMERESNEERKNDKDWESPEERKFPEERERRPNGMMEETIYIGNAGLVLLHPFLHTYFSRLGLLGTEGFTGEEAQFKAVHLLQYLVDGMEEHPEQGLALNKLLCGLRVDEPVPFQVSFTEQEKEVSTELLNVLRVQWEKLKNTSIEGLRASFLQRQGALTEAEEGWKLQVEQRAYDVLLQTLPWGLGMIKLSWMKKIIYTEWS